MGFRESTRTRKELTNIKVTGSLFKRCISYNYQQIVSEYFKVPTTHVESEKVTNTVGTFLNGVKKKAILKERLAIHISR
ncbi:hypothetical protein [Emticicia sp. C21]|uniref:hypothetical protein n=1 Tax=Emticicia sp. C21 TaxID=2302915 RepID=UPI000E3564CD|nr:hypothetical protein [Emticicia sp. C21]RFS15888.1 hypothetical protein D0T08_13350 [Emticicia sp. C21]